MWYAPSWICPKTFAVDIFQKIWYVPKLLQRIFSRRLFTHPTMVSTSGGPGAWSALTEIGWNIKKICLCLCMLLCEGETDSNTRWWCQDSHSQSTSAGNSKDTVKKIREGSYSRGNQRIQPFWAQLGQLWPARSTIRFGRCVQLRTLGDPLRGEVLENTNCRSNSASLATLEYERLRNGLHLCRHAS